MMMGEDLGIKAKEAAVQEVAKLLPLPELLQSIASIKADYITRQQSSYTGTERNSDLQGRLNEDLRSRQLICLPIELSSLNSASSAIFHHMNTIFSDPSLIPGWEV
ncbi:hypothetical protein Vadar_018935 [Vaccinium darrowii]|uniref:Uncharacterized protein n=1 Tax=Vaccinium darrowii TaxID=229202 RepID=A0ACB7XIH2_9ERIC|nr:hypothetical protein Vadar_018935 [Vaccinium darrowii]